MQTQENPNCPDAMPREEYPAACGLLKLYAKTFDTENDRPSERLAPWLFNPDFDAQGLRTIQENATTALMDHFSYLIHTKDYQAVRKQADLMELRSQEARVLDKLERQGATPEALIKEKTEYEERRQKRSEAYIQFTAAGREAQNGIVELRKICACLGFEPQTTAQRNNPSDPDLMAKFGLQT